VIPSFVPDADFEVELCVVLGKTCSNVTDDEALDYVLGYTTSNDVAARKAQTITTQFSHGKGFDTFAPVGPALVHAKSIPDPQQLEMRTTLNGQEMQHAKLDTMIFSVARIVSHLSQVSQLELFQD
jgi:2-keto-4-pentenoate hydratase/2-oxohepta-3-ene-1,7-dioic acid hydratase in catechol pathway